ncbi:plasma membrane ascorbate-dependent reductase CYBRD1 isoform X1 [Ambystoma mexicanum]
MEGYRTFLSLLACSLLLGFLGVLFALVWVFHWREGLSWDGGLAEFNWHPVLMVAGFIFIQGIAITVYRLPWTWNCSKLLMKFIHAGLHCIALILVVVSVVAVFDFHNAKNIPNMYSLHSWVGLTLVILYAMQILFGFLVYLLPFAPVSLRTSLMPLHTFSGIFIFGAVIATALMGFTEKLIFALKNPSYSTSPPEAIFVNTLGILILLFGGFVLWMVTRPQWKRPQELISKFQPSTGATPDCTEEVSTATACSNDDKSDVEFNSEAAARRRKLDEAGQR